MINESKRWVSVAAWVPLPVGLALIAVTVRYWMPAYEIGRTPDDPGLIAVTSLGIFTFAAFGGLLASRRPRNPIGWIFCFAAMSYALEGSSWAYAVYADATSALPGWRYAAWLSNWIWLPGIAAIGTFLLLLFPNGRLLSSRWRPVVWLSVGMIVAVSAGSALLPGPLEDFPSVVNPLAVPASLASVVEALGGFGYPLLPLCIALSVVSLILRARRAGTIERQQIKWIGYVAAFFPLGLTYALMAEEWNGLSALAVFAPLCAIPAASAIAIQRYRLFEINRLISRTVSYAIVTAVLGGVFVLVALMPTLIAGTGDSPDWLIAVATLLIIALFRPVRRRVQIAVDRRFNRARYNAVQTIETFSAHLREQVDIDALGTELRSVVGRTMQPSHVSLWLRSEP